MSLPRTRRDMGHAGYVFKGSGTCRSCGAPIEWWLTTKGKSMPFDPPASTEEFAALMEEAINHWSTCPNSKQHKAQGPEATRFQNTERIAQQLRARLVFVLDEDGYSYAAKHGQNAEDLAHELISAANQIRREMGGR